MTLAKRLREFLPTVFKKYGALNARQYAYRAETAHILPKGKAQFDYVNSILTELREEGILPWDAVLDSKRDFKPRMVTTSEESDEHLDFAKNEFKEYPERFGLPRWQYQPIVPVIFTEKEGLIEYFEGIAWDRAVTIYAQQGQAGKSHLHEVIMPWLKELIADEKKVRILYLGDHDDEGFQIPLTMVESLTRWGLPIQYATHEIYPKLKDGIENEGTDINFERISLTTEQIESLHLDKDKINPKSTIAKKFVNFKVELEAMEPHILKNTIAQAIDRTWDNKADKKRLTKQEAMREVISEKIQELTSRW